MSTEPETYPERVKRIKRDHGVTTMAARRVATAEIRLARALRDKRTLALAEALRQAQPQNRPDPARGTP